MPVTSEKIAVPMGAITGPPDCTNRKSKIIEVTTLITLRTAIICRVTDVLSTSMFFRGYKLDNSQDKQYERH